jgi:arylsulfatase A-like enzyme
MKTKPVNKILLAVLALTISIPLISQKKKKEKPNILFIVVDDLKPVLGIYGNKQVKTPAMDKLAKKAVMFENAYVQQAVCAPSRISAFTGMRPDRTKVTDLRTDMRKMNPDIVTLPQFFKRHGYETAGLGKLMHGARNNDPRSWTIPWKDGAKLSYAKGYKAPVFNMFQNPETQKLVENVDLSSMKRKEIVQFLRQNNAFQAIECLDVPDDAYTDGAVANEAVDLLDSFASSKKLFFLAVGFHKPHLPFVAPKKYWDMYDRKKIPLAEFQQHAKNSPKYAYHTWGELRKYSDIPAQGALDTAKQKELIHAYWSSVSYVDAQIGKVLDALKEKGLAKNTIVVLWGDHGWHLGDHGLWCKHTNFEQATKTPLIISAPGYKKNKKAAGMTEIVDLFPTLVEYAGFKVPEKLEGESLIPMLKNPNTEIKDYAISQYPRGKNIMGYSIRTKRYRLTLWLQGDFKNNELYRDPQIAAVELYDYQNDPLEKTSLADNPEYKNIINNLQSKLLNILISKANIQKKQHK